MRASLTAIVFLFFAPVARSQAPSDAPRALPRQVLDDPKNGKPPESFRTDAPTQFDTATLRSKRVSNQWQLWAGSQLIKDFGSAQADAYEALQLFRELRVNARGSVGGIFEYFLVDQRAPSAALAKKQVVPFDLDGLRVEQMNGQWVLRDPNLILYNFGSAERDALQALAICRQYGFNQVGVVGQPIPTLKYLLKDPHPSLTRRSSSAIVPASAKMQASEAPHRQLFVPGTGPVGTLTPIDYRRLDLRRDGGDWTLYDGRTVLGRFGRQDRAAQSTLELLQQFRCSEICRFGSEGFGFVLDNGRPPSGSLVGLASRSFKLDRLTVRDVEGNWSICEDQRVLFTFGKDETAARQALAAIQHFHFDTYIPIANGQLGSLYLFVRLR